MSANIIFETKERIYGYLPKDREWIQYEGKLTIKKNVKNPVILEMKFVPPHPPWFELPQTRTIKAESITEIYVKVSRFLKRYGIEFKC